MPETVHFLDRAKANNDTSHCKILKQTLKVESFFKNCVRQANKKIKLQKKHQYALLAELWTWIMSIEFSQQNQVWYGTEVCTDKGKHCNGTAGNRLSSMCYLKHDLRLYFEDCNEIFHSTVNGFGNNILWSVVQNYNSLLNDKTFLSCACTVTGMPQRYEDYSTDTLETEMEYFTLIYKHWLKIHVQTHEILYKNIYIL